LTRADFVAWAKASGVRGDAFVLDGGHPSEAFVLDQQGTAWAVYYSERGLDQDRRWFLTEGEALADLRSRLVTALEITSS
jgi:hypothetical protein